VINTHLNSIKQFFDTNQLLDDITITDIHRFVEYRSATGIKDNTLRLSISILKGVFDRADRLGYRVPDITFPYIKSSSQRVRFLSKDEEDALLYELDPKQKRKGFGGVQRQQIQDLRDLVIILLDTGMRVQEAAQLPWSAIDFNKNTIHIFRSKVGNESILSMTDRVREVLQRRYNVKTSTYIFHNSDRGPRKYLPEAFARAINRAGLNTREKIQQWGCKATYHTLRHTFASRLAQAGVSIQKIGQLLGHKDIHTTMVYSHLIPNNVSAEAAGILNRMNGVSNL
jgi:integrase